MYFSSDIFFLPLVSIFLPLYSITKLLNQPIARLLLDDTAAPTPGNGQDVIQAKATTIHMIFFKVLSKDLFGRTSRFYQRTFSMC